MSKNFKTFETVKGSKVIVDINQVLDIYQKEEKWIEFHFLDGRSVSYDCGDYKTVQKIMESLIEEPTFQFPEQAVVDEPDFSTSTFPKVLRRTE